MKGMRNDTWDNVGHLGAVANLLSTADGDGVAARVRRRSWWWQQLGFAVDLDGGG
jgi:hypothetical protein